MLSFLQVAQDPATEMSEVLSSPTTVRWLVSLLGSTIAVLEDHQVYTLNCPTTLIGSTPLLQLLHKPFTNC